MITQQEKKILGILALGGVILFIVGAIAVLCVIVHFITKLW